MKITAEIQEALPVLPAPYANSIQGPPHPSNRCLQSATRCNAAGAEFDAMPEHVQLEAVSQLTIFSRVEPSHKTKLVELLKSQVGSLSTSHSMLCSLTLPLCQP